MEEKGSADTEPYLAARCRFGPGVHQQRNHGEGSLGHSEADLPAEKSNFPGHHVQEVLSGQMCRR
jgi:hypothetical protein